MVERSDLNPKKENGKFLGAPKKESGKLFQDRNTVLILPFFKKLFSLVSTYL